MMGAVSFLLSPVGRMVGAAVGLVLLLAWFYSWAATNGREQCELRVAQETQKIREQVQTSLREAVEEASSRAEKAEAEAAELEKRVAEIIEQARSDIESDAVCIPPDTAERLRDLR